MFKGVMDIYNEPVQKVIKDIETKQKPTDVYIVLNQFLINNKKTFNSDIKGASSVGRVRDAIYSNISSLYISFNTAAKKLSDNKVSFETILGKSPSPNIKKIFNQTNDKKRAELIVKFSNDLLYTLAKGLNIKDEDLDIILSKAVGQVDQSNTNNKANTNNQNTNTENTNTENTNTENTNTENTATGERTAPSYNTLVNTISDKSLKNLKTAVVTWFQANIYQYLETNLKIDTTTNQAETNDTDKLFNEVTTTQNKAGIKKMVSSIIKLNDPKKYAAVRDALAKLGIVNPDDINKF
jgi:hypothetical protein